MGAILGLFCNDIRYIIQSSEGVGPYCANCCSKKALTEALAEIAQYWKIDSFDLIDIIVSENRAASRQTVEYTGRNNGVSLNTINAVFRDFKDGYLCKIHEFQGTTTMATLRG